MNISLREYSLLINKHNQKLINILENQKIFWVSNMLISFWLCLFIIKWKHLPVSCDPNVKSHLEALHKRFAIVNM